MMMHLSRKTFVGGLAGVLLQWRSILASTPQPRRYYHTNWWDPYVDNIQDVDTYLRRKFRQDVTDKSTGLGVDAIVEALFKIVADGNNAGESWRLTKAKCFAFQVERQSIDVSHFDWFPSIAIWDRWTRPISKIILKRKQEVNSRLLPEWVVNEWNAGNESGEWKMWQDFDHSVPDWRAIMSLGFPGMKKCLEKYALKGDPFYEGLGIAMDAILKGIDRFIEQGKKNLGRVACLQSATRRVEDNAPYRTNRLTKEIACLERLRNGPPQTAYDMMMFVWLYFFYSEHLDGIQCRSLTELDVFLTPYYDADIIAGRTTEAEFREQLKHFFWQWGSVNNYFNQPIGLGGTKRDGTSEFNHVSKIILDIADECALPTPKFLVKVASNTPDWALEKMLDMARRRRSISFIGEESAAAALRKWCDASDEDCRTMALRGCYEFGLRDSLNLTDVGQINLSKPIELILSTAMNGGSRPNSFDAFFSEYIRRLVDCTTHARRLAFEYEKVLHEINPANCMTLATEHAIKVRKDGFADGCPRGNSSSIRAIGLGTTVDALMSIKEIVYERRILPLERLGEVMSANWSGYETLRLRMLRSKRKWGNNDAEANQIGKRIIESFADVLNGIPNSRGGIFMASGHSSRRFIELGMRTGATPDGRLAGEELSKNLSPTMGADTEGATALVSTLAVSDASVLPGDYPLDVMLHPSTCEGERGLALMKSIVRLFHRNGGSVIQFTVFSAEQLRDAQRHPEKYENLQVRICGWNVRWNDMTKKEQDAYIRRAENIMK